jgi:hypothetical protein
VSSAAAAPPAARRAVPLALAALATLLLQEAAVRAVFPLAEIANLNRLHYTPLAKQPMLALVSNLAHASYRWRSELDHAESIHRLNLYGFRDREWSVERPGDAVRVAFFGDSFVEGYLAAADETIPARFAAAARAAGEPVEAMNWGIGAAGIEEYFSLIGDAVPLYRPEHVFLVLYENDLYQIRYQSSWLATREPVRGPWWWPRAVWVVGEVQAGRRVPKRWTSRPFDFLVPVPNPRNPWSDPRWAAWAATVVEPEIAEVMKRGGLNPFLANAPAALEQSLRTPVSLHAPIADLAAFAERHGAKAWVLYLPYRNQVSDRYASTLRYSQPLTTSLLAPRYQSHAISIASACASAGVPFLDLTPALRAAESGGEPLYFDYDDHMRPAGYRLVAETAHAWWREQSR